MYPFVNWGRQAVVERIARLVEAELDFEAVVAEVQTVERMIKRVIVIGGLRNWPGGRHADPVRAREFRARIYRAKFKTLKNHWATIFPDRPRLPAFIDEVVGKEAWAALTFNKDLERTTERSFGEFCDRRKMRYGLIPTRHHIVHEGFSPPAAEVLLHARFGLHVVKSLSAAFDGKSWPDPFTQVPRIPKVK
jgi:hypothetical protein